MLSDRQKEQLSAEMIPLFQELEQDVIQDIARRVRKESRWTETAELQAKTLEALGYKPMEIRNKVMRELKADKAYQAMIAKNTLEYKRAVRDRIKQLVADAKERGDDIVSRAGTMAFNDDLAFWESKGRHLRHSSELAEINTTASHRLGHELKNLTHSTGFKFVGAPVRIDNAFSHAMDSAIMNVATGAFSSGQATEKVVSDLEKSGIRHVDFGSGISRGIDVAAALAVRTTLGQMAAQISMSNTEELGTDLVEVSSHAGAREGDGHADHAYWQGRVYSISGRQHPEEEKRLGYKIYKLSDVTGYPDDPLGLCGYNCRHTFYPFLEGISEPNPIVKDPEPVTVDGRTYTYYQATQVQRRLERELRELKRQYIGGDETRLAAIKAKEQRYARFCSKAGLKQNLERLYVKGYKRDFEYIKPTTTVYNKNTVVDNNRTLKRFDKDTVKKLDRKQLEHYATDIFARKQKGLSYDEGVRRAKALMDGNTDAQLRKYIVKYQQNLVFKPKNDIITPTEHVIHLDKKENLSNYDLTKIAPAQDKHVVGTNSYKNLSETRAYAPSYLTISPDKISELVAKYAGKGVNLYDSHGNWTHTELIVTNDENIGVVVNNLNGKTQETNVFKIHYSQKGVHIVPDYIRKKQRYTI
jgi:hypothetical protein